MKSAIRPVEPQDAAAIQAIYAPFVADGATSFETVVPDVAEIQRRIAAQRDQYPWLVFTADNSVQGYAYASAHRTREAYRWSVDVSVYVATSAHRRGIGRALYGALFDLLRLQGFMNAYAGITLPNASSVGLHESLGFEPVGIYRRVGFKFGQWHDVAWLHLRLAEEPHPPEPRPLAAVLGTEGVVDGIARHASSVRLS